MNLSGKQKDRTTTNSEIHVLLVFGVAIGKGPWGIEPLILV